MTTLKTIVATAAVAVGGTVAAFSGLHLGQSPADAATAMQPAKAATYTISMSAKDLAGLAAMMKGQAGTQLAGHRVTRHHRAQTHQAKRATAKHPVAARHAAAPSSGAASGSSHHSQTHHSSSATHHAYQRGDGEGGCVAPHSGDCGDGGGCD